MSKVFVLDTHKQPLNPVHPGRALSRPPLPSREEARMSKVFVLDTHKQPLNPVHPGRARLLLSSGKAAVLKRYPFTIILKTVVEQSVLEPLRVKIDPGSKTTGLALVNDATRRAFPKTHWLDAACVGKNTPERLRLKGVVPLLIKANGHGCRQLCLMDEHGFPRTKPKQKKFRHLFRTGDIVQARVPAHLKHPGVHVGRVSAKANGAFTIATRSGKVTDIGKKYCRCLQRADGYGYLQKGEAAFLPAP